MAYQRRHSTLTPSDSSNPQYILSQMHSLGCDLGQHRTGAREQLLKLSHALISSLELPSETIQRIGWAEVSPPSHPPSFAPSNLTNKLPLPPARPHSIPPHSNRPQPPQPPPSRRPIGPNLPLPRLHQRRRPAPRLPHPQAPSRHQRPPRSRRRHLLPHPLHKGPRHPAGLPRRPDLHLRRRRPALPPPPRLSEGDGLPPPRDRRRERALPGRARDGPALLRVAGRAPALRGRVREFRVDVPRRQAELGG